jgi:hypothetical protein
MDKMTATTLSQYNAQKHRCGTVITRPGRYTTRSGEVVTIERLGGYGGYWAYGQYADGTVESWFVSGRLLPLYQSLNDIVGSAS